MEKIYRFPEIESFRMKYIYVYNGRKEGCRCGCNGRYSYTPQMSVKIGHTNPKDISDTRVKNIINKIKKFGEQFGIEHTESLTEDIYNVEIESGRVYTVYILKENQLTEAEQGYPGGSLHLDGL